MALQYTRKKDDNDERTLNVTEFIDRMCELNRRPEVRVKIDKIESTE